MPGIKVPKMLMTRTVGGRKRHRNSVLKAPKITHLYTKARNKSLGNS